MYGTSIFYTKKKKIRNLENAQNRKYTNFPKTKQRAINNFLSAQLEKYAQWRMEKSLKRCEIRFDKMFSKSNNRGWVWRWMLMRKTSNVQVTKFHADRCDLRHPLYSSATPKVLTASTSPLGYTSSVHWSTKVPWHVCRQEWRLYRVVQ